MAKVVQELFKGFTAAGTAPGSHRIPILRLSPKERIHQCGKGNDFIIGYNPQESVKQIKSKGAAPCGTAPYMAYGTLRKQQYTNDYKTLNATVKPAITIETMLISLIRMFKLGPAVSLNGSPTVSPVTAAL